MSRVLPPLPPGKCLKLYRQLLPFVPHRVLDGLRHAPRGTVPPPAPLPCAMLYADISGFTELAEALSGRGPREVEELTRIINRIFTGLLRIAKRHGGSLTKFGGDALLLVFPAPPRGLRAAANSALHTAVGMHDWLQRQPAIMAAGRARVLRIRIGAAAGEPCAGVLGDAGRREYMLFGAVMNDLTRAAALAGAGQIVLTRALAALLPRGVATRPRRNGFVELRRGRRLPAGGCLPPLSLPLRRVRDLPACRALVEIIRPFIPPELWHKYLTAGWREQFIGEHRVVTALFINLRGADCLADRGGGHRCGNLSRFSAEYFTRLLAVVRAHGGVFARMDPHPHGTKILVIFGALLAREDDAPQALRCAAALRAMLPAVNAALRHGCRRARHECALTQCMGVNTGPAFCGLVGSPACKEYTVIGDAVNVAARLMEMAPPGAICAGTATMRGSELHWRTRARTARLRGKRARCGFFELRRPLPPGDGGTAPPPAIVGRKRELRRLRELLAAVCAGQSQTLLLTGEAGVGKSTLRLELENMARAARLRLLVAEGQPQRCLTPCAVWADIIRQATVRGQAEPLAGLPAPGTDRGGELPLLAALLGVSRKAGAAATGDGRSPAATEALTAAVAEVVAAVVQELAARRPLLIVLDDIHWLDEDSLDVLARLMTVGCRAGLGLLLLRRPEPLSCLARWRRQPRFHEMQLRDLSRAETATLVRRHPAGAMLPPATLAEIYGRTGGNPFFVSELLASIAGNGGHTAIPGKVRTLVISRYDRLTEAEKAALRVAAVAGRAFPARLVQELGRRQVPAGNGDAVLGELTRRQFIRPWGPDAAGRHVFRHSITREAIYSVMGESQKRELHRAVAHWLERNGGGGMAPAEELAGHYRAAGDCEPAARCFTRAADRAREVFANEAAVKYYGEAIALCAGGWRQRRAERRCLMALHRDRGLVLRLTGHYDRALADFRALEKLARRAGDRRQRALALDYAGGTLRWQGHQRAALAACTRALAAARALGDNKLLATCYNSIAVIHWYLGHYRLAIGMGERSLALRRRAGDRRLLARGLFSVGNAYVKVCDFAEAERCFRLLLRLATAGGDPVGRAYALDGLGVCADNRGEWSKALALHREGGAIRAKTGDRRGLVYSLLGMGDTCRLTGNTRAAQRYYARAREIVMCTEDENQGSEVRCRLGLLALARGDRARAEAELTAALSAAQRLHFHEGIISAVAGLAESALGAGNLARAAKLQQRLARLARQSGMRDYAARGLLIAARLALRAQRCAPAGRQAGQALAIADSCGLAQLRLDALLLLKRIARSADEARAERRLARPAGGKKHS